MDLEQLRESPVGELVPIAGTEPRTGDDYRHHAFLPHPLPGEINLEPASWTAASRAEAALARLDQAAKQVPDPGLLRQPALRREAQSTSALEGTYARFDQVLEPELGDRARSPVEVREILNYVVAAEHAFVWIRERPITPTLMAELQRTLVRGTPSEHSDAGRLRDRQVVIGARGSSVVDARFVPPPPGDQLRAGVEAWAAWVDGGPPDLGPVVRAAMAHYQFEALHPFSDGNGRIGRLAIVMQLMRDGVLDEPILVVSPWLEARRSEYQDRLLALSQTGLWDPWVRFFATGLAAAADTTRDRVDRLLAWRDRTLALVRGAGVSGVAERVAGELIGSPFVRASAVAAAHGVTHQGAMNALRRLVALGVLREEKRNGRVVFVATPVVALLSA